jgi:nucleoid DNA-binding protein
MPLPKISTPSYELSLPSSGQKVSYRPFLVREEKLLVLALESEDNKEITTAVKQVIKNCIESPKSIKVESLPTFDIEYLFLNIRGKSVGEVVEVNIICPDDNVTQVPIEIPINQIEVEKNEKHTTKIKVDDSITMEMKYPSLDQFIKTNFDFSQDNNVEQSFELIASCIDKIYTEEEVWDSADVTKKELVDFLDQMNSVQFKQIETFFETMPKLTHKVKITNPNTKVKSEVILEGLSAFFA